MLSYRRRSPLMEVRVGSTSRLRDRRLGMLEWLVVCMPNERLEERRLLNATMG